MATTVHYKDWGATTILTTALSFTSVMASTGEMTMAANGWDGAEVIVSALFSTAPTLDMECYVYAAFDGSYNLATDDAVWSVNIGHVTNASKRHAFQTSWNRFKLGLNIASTSQTGEATVRVKPWRWRSE